MTQVIGVIFWIIFSICVLNAFGVSLSSLLLPFATSFLGFSFVFGNSFKSIWESFLFIFNTKAFEVGDRITLQITPQYPTLIVSKIQLLNTLFYSPDGRMFVIPNSILSTSTIIQYKRSRDYVISKDIQIGFDTTPKQIEQLQARLTLWCKNNPHFPYKKPFYNITGIDTLAKITMNIWIELRDVSWQSIGIFLPAETQLLLQIQAICTDLQIICYSPMTRAWVEPTKVPDPAPDPVKKEDKKTI